MSNELNTQLSGMKQDIHDTRTEFTQSLAALCGQWMRNFKTLIVS